jgi:hypothetical protein
VDLCDNAPYPIMGVGMPSCDVHTLDDVVYVPSFTKNLLFVSSMKDLKSESKFDDQQIIIKDCDPNLGRVLAKGITTASLYKLLVDSINHRDLVEDSDNSCELWHMRCGHLHYKTLLLLKEMVQGLSNF